MYIYPVGNVSAESEADVVLKLPGGNEPPAGTPYCNWVVSYAAEGDGQFPINAPGGPEVPSCTAINSPQKI